MHRVVKSHLEDFRKKFSVTLNEDRSFEAFLNYSAFRRVSSDSVNPIDLIYDGDDPGIDGVLVFLEDSFVSSAEEVSDFFQARKRDVDATVVFTQAKTGESWDKKEINAFQSAILDFLSDDHQYPHSEYMENARAIFEVLISNVGKIRGGKPKAECIFATTARPATEREITAAIRTLGKSIEDSGLFSSVSAELVDRNKIVSMWTGAEGQVETTLKVLGSAAFLKAPAIEEGYVVTVLAKEFIDNILTDENGRLRQRIFDENVRDFIGLGGEINSEMANTLVDAIKQKRFGLLNNGVTIVSPDVRLAGFELYLRDYQIVNGCQTSNVLFDHRAVVGSDITLMLKVIETSDAVVVDDIVRSTNRQTKVDDDQFLATLDAVKGIEKYFDALGADDEYRLYFERRKNQFAHNLDVKAIRVFDIKEIARCAAAMFLDRPETASRYPNRLTGEMKDIVFNARNAEEIYHTAAYASYRLRLLMGNGRVDAKYGKFRWHILMAIKYFLCGEKTPQLTSGKIESICKTVKEFMARSDDAAIAQIRDLCSSIIKIEDVSRDRIKTPTFTLEVKNKALEFRKV
jgi:hypothetical protein